MEEDLLLCDCPGLVFPSAESNKSEMVSLNKVLDSERSDSNRQLERPSATSWPVVWTNPPIGIQPIL